MYACLAVLFARTTTTTTTITTTTSTNHTPIPGPLRGTRWMFPPATLPLEMVAFLALTLVAPQQRCAILKLSLFWGAGSGGVPWLQAALTSLVSPYRYIHRCIYTYNAITVGKVTGGFWNPPVTNRIPASIVISIVTFIVISIVIMLLLLGRLGSGLVPLAKASA